MKAFVWRNAGHLVTVGALLVAELLVADVTAVYYRLFLRPRLLRAGAQTCDSYKPLFPN